MNKTCARCQKVVYPIEELKCLDKVSDNKEFHNFQLETYDQCL